ncbi:hypothetical protein C2E23DRAFT_864455 [Lenzites betulinus]|nr:hypothetical protein C2E23DRAFT_864455 [Lenzites betulinus]
MPADVQTVPQLPPIAPQTPFTADNYPWERHYPPSSWPPSLPTADLRRTKSTSPNARILPGSSVLAESRSHSRSGSRVLVLPSASTAEPIVISPPARTHSRSASAAMSRPLPQPSTSDSTVRSHTRSKSRPLPLPLPPKDPLQYADHLLSRTESLPLPRTSAMSAPAAAQPPSEPAILRSAPVHRMESSHPHAHPRPRPIFGASPGQPHVPRETPPPIPASAPARPGLPATPRRQDDNRGKERGRSPQMAPVTVRSSPKRSLEPAPSAWAKQPNDQFARKWVLERNGKRLTQDAMVVAQQLRLLR